MVEWLEVVLILFIYAINALLIFGANYFYGFNFAVLFGIVLILATRDRNRELGSSW